MIPRRDRATVYHEAGHAVAAHFWESVVQT
jgi:hypothetical protein